PLARRIQDWATGCGTEGSSQKQGGRVKEIAMAFRHVVAVAGTLIIGLACSAGAQSGKPGPDEMVNNPPFANWAQFKPGTTVTQKEIVSMPDGRKLEQTITHKLVQKSKDRVVVETIVKDKMAGTEENSRET